MAKKTGQCKACGNLVSRQAKFCPHCGERKPYKDSNETIISIIIVIVLGLFIIGSFGSEKPDQNTSIKEVKNNISVSKKPTVFSKDEIWIIKKWAERKDPDALYLLAYAYSDQFIDTGIDKKDEYLSARLYEDSAQLGHPDAQAALSTLYSLGKFVPEDRVKSFELLKMAASHGDPVYQALLAGEYESGKGTAKDIKKSNELYLMSANQGFGVAQAILATNYRLGKGVRKDNIQAYKWHHLAKMTGHPGGGATGFRGLSFEELLAEEMTEDDVREAKDLIDEWLKNSPDFPYEQSHITSVRKIYERIISKESEDNNNKTQSMTSDSSESPQKECKAEDDQPYPCALKDVINASDWRKILSALYFAITMEPNTPIAWSNEKDSESGKIVLLEKAKGRCAKYKLIAQDKEVEFEWCLLAPVDKAPQIKKGQSPSKIIASCLVMASKTYEVPPAILLGVYEADGGEIGQSYTEGGLTLLGIMKIPEKYIGEVADIWEVSEGTAIQWVKDDPCTGAGLSAWKLRNYLNETGSLGAALMKYGRDRGYDGKSFKEDVKAKLKEHDLIKKDVPLSENIAGLPRFSPESYCKNIASTMRPYSEMIYGSCLDMEQSSYNKLKRGWHDFPSAVKTYCANISSAVGGGSYNTLEACIDMELEERRKNSGRGFTY